MPNLHTLASYEVQNTIELKHKINSFKRHILNLEKINSKSRSNSVYSSCNNSPTFYPSINSNTKNNQSPSHQSKLFNRYEKEKLNSITKDNMFLVSKMIKIDSGHSKYNDPQFYSTFTQLRNNFLITKINDRKRSLTQITRENKTLSKKLIRCSSSQKPSHCNEWKKDWGKNLKIYSQNLSKKFPKLSYDYRSLACKEINQQIKPFNRLKLRL